MINLKDEQWLKKVLADYVSQQTEVTRPEENLAGFTMLTAQLIKGLEKRIAQLKQKHAQQPGFQKLSGELDIIAKQLFFLRRFCEDRKHGGKDD